MKPVPGIEAAIGLSYIVKKPLYSTYSELQTFMQVHAIQTEIFTNS